MMLKKTSDEVSPILLDVGGTFIKCGDGREVPVDSGGSSESITASLRKAAGNLKAGDCVAVAIPGAFDYDNGIFLMKHKFASVYGCRFSDMVLEGTGLTEQDVKFRFIHDVNCMLLGEIVSGAAAGRGNTALVTLGTGLGFSMCVDGKILENAMKSPLVSIYNLPYGEGILEDYASKRGIISGYLRHGGKCGTEALTVKKIAEMARLGDGAAAAAFSSAGQILGEVLSPVLGKYGIRCLLFGGQISRSFDLMEEALRKSLHDVPELACTGPVSDFDNATFNGLKKFLQYPINQLNLW